MSSGDTVYGTTDIGPGTHCVGLQCLLGAFILKPGSHVVCLLVLIAGQVVAFKAQPACVVTGQVVAFKAQPARDCLESYKAQPVRTLSAAASSLGQRTWLQLSLAALTGPCFACSSSAALCCAHACCTRE